MVEQTGFIPSDCHNHRIQKKVVEKVKGKKTKLGLSATVRFVGLLFCPGDDIVAATLAALNHNSGHQEVQAILPPPLIIEKERIIYDKNRKRRKLQY